MTGLALLARRATILLCLVAASVGPGSLARAEAPPQTPDARNVGLAERRAADAYDAYNRKDYASAVALYLEAYEASPSGMILYNVARIYDTKLADRPLAMTFYRRYIADPGAEPERIKFANERLTELRAAEAASVEPPRPASGASGASGARPALRGAPGAAPAQIPGPAPAVDGDRGGWSALRWTGVTLGVLGLAGVGVGAGFGLAAASKESTARETCDGARCTTQAGVDAARAAADRATVSNIAFAAGGGLLAAGTALFFLGGDARRSERGSAAKLAVDASASSSSLAVRLRGTW